MNGPPLRIRAREPSPGSGSLAARIFAPQLELLQTLVPLDYWLIGLQLGGSIDIMGQHGDPDPLVKANLIPLMCASEVRRDPALVSLPFPASQPGCVCKTRLPGTDGLAVVGGFGACGKPGGHYTNAREIRACLITIIRALRLHVYLAESERRIQKAHRDARRDRLTDVLNLAGWEKELRKAARARIEAAVGFLDLDSLKAINDACGHRAGDALLQRTAWTIRRMIRRGDCVARLGGDEFAVLMPNASSADANDLASRLQRALRNTGIEASIGMALSSEASSLDKAVELADARMYADKRSKITRKSANLAV